MQQDFLTHKEAARVVGEDPRTFAKRKVDPIGYLKAGDRTFPIYTREGIEALKNQEKEQNEQSE